MGLLYVPNEIGMRSMYEARKGAGVSESAGADVNFVNGNSAVRI